jgi:multidrug efflux pump subunit AcrA (membrane-fusion protein)
LGDLALPLGVCRRGLATFDNQVDPTTGTVKLRAVLDNADGMLFPNQFVNVKLLVDKLVDATVVPVSAVQRGQQGTFVYVVNADNSVSVRPIVIHRQPESRHLRFCAHAGIPRSPQDLTQLPKNLHI